jgi:hypothetical protein
MVSILKIKYDEIDTEVTEEQYVRLVNLSLDAKNKSITQAFYLTCAAKILKVDPKTIKFKQLNLKVKRSEELPNG